MPAGSGSLGGLSGGPVFDGDGRVVGVVLAEARRRGRTYTATPETMAEALAEGGVTADAVRGAPIAASAYATVARDLIQGLRVARVLCVGPS